ncbi:MAG: alkyl hydroperoxide reductase/Thiol specific antioxidant/Mal allergen [Deltaproteobacteria bacterium]|nr:alkyl hydroperoxide reductase/Thiol specific antioxidant/Mal allergen [Deltaproteobacteria bacterium]
MLAFQADLAAFEDQGAQVLGVSGDTVETHRRFAEQHGIRFPLIADIDGTIARNYPGGRVTYVIDRAGIVRHVMKGMPDNGRLLEALKSLE